MDKLKNITSVVWNILYKYCILIVLPLSFVFFGLNKYPHLISFSAAADTMMYSFFSVLVLYFIPRFKYDHFRSALITSWAGSLLLFYRDIYTSIARVPALDLIDYSPVNVGFSLVITLIVLLKLIRFSQIRIRQMYLYVNSLFAVFFLFNLVVFASLIIKPATCLLDIQKVEFTENPKKENPDVHCILFDEYAGIETMRLFHKYDNNDLNNALNKLGFFVSNNSYSNYNSTWISCASLLEMNYLDDNKLLTLNGNKKYLYGESVIYNNNVFNYFKTSGYKTINNSFFNIKADESNKKVIINVDNNILKENTFFEYSKKSFLNHIPFNNIQIVLGTMMGAHYKYNQSVLNQFNYELTRVYNDPKFVYTHLLMPHPPYLLSAKGVRNFREAYQIKHEKQSEFYIEYVKETNKHIVRMVNSILSKNKNSIIIITSDHGDRWSINRNDNLDFNNFFAIYKPDRNYTGFTDSINTVNVFRTLLNNQFGQNLPILESRRQDVLNLD
jgi:hypothetical protein